MLWLEQTLLAGILSALMFYLSLISLRKIFVDTRLFAERRHIDRFVVDRRLCISTQLQTRVLRLSELNLFRIYQDLGPDLRVHNSRHSYFVLRIDTVI